MSAGDVDPAEAERLGRRQSLLAIALLPPVLASLVLLAGNRWAFWEGPAAWVAVGVVLLLALLGQLVARLHPGLRARTAEANRIQFALRHRVDPGPDLRQRIDVHARQMAGMRWLLWFLPLGPLGALIGARWDRPLTTIPAACVLLGLFAAFLLWWHRQTRAARRWSQDPPGPARGIPPPGRRERWLTGRRGVLSMVAVVLLLASGIAASAALLR